MASTSKLQLFRVNLVHEWTQQGTAYVLAPDEAAARQAASDYSEPDHAEAEFNSTTATRSLAVSPEEVSALLIELQQKQNDCLAGAELIIPSPNGRHFESVDHQEFFAAFTVEQLEQARIAALEKNNGQLSLLASASG
jgi:hypothetical protein